jgi:hypothetical protein
MVGKEEAEPEVDAASVSREVRASVYASPNLAIAEEEGALWRGARSVS